MKRSKFGLYFIVIVVAFIIYGGYRANQGSSSTSSSSPAVPTNVSSPAESSASSSSSSGEPAAIVQSQPVAPDATANFIKYIAADKSWSIKYPKELLLKTESADLVSFESGANILTVNRADKIVSNFKGYTEAKSSDLTIAGEKATEKNEDSRDHVGGYPTTKIIIVDFSHSGIKYQITYEFGYNGPDSDKYLDTANAAISSFSF